MRLLTDKEEKNLQILTTKGIEVALLEPTETGLSKSIIDATQSLRYLLKRWKIHDYDQQKQGPENKNVISANLLDIFNLFPSKVSLYRPQTKNGDPRIWFSGLVSYCIPHEILAIAVFENELWVLNITRLNLQESEITNGPILDFFNTYAKENNSIALELLEKIKLIASRGYIPSGIDADTSIGRLLETELGISMNSSQIPDYKGIEIKSFRSRREDRKNLFAQVPDWDVSKFKSSKEILNKFGYTRLGIFRLYCTVNALRYNPQGLKLNIDNKTDLLLEESSDASVGAFAAWRMGKLRQRLIEKHAETFWVEADTKMENGHEWFKFTKIEHTKGPLVAQLETLILDGKISLDHLIKRVGTGTIEKGPIFKLEQHSLALLFPPSKAYKLQD